MRRLVTRELRALARCRPLWILPPLVAVIGWAMLPVNADAYLRYIYFDPQGYDQELVWYHADVLAVYTSGLAWTQLIALVVGAYLVLREPRLAHRRSGPADDGDPTDPGRLVLAKASAAAIFGAVLAVADLAMVLPNAQRYLADHHIPRDAGGIPADRLTLADPQVWTTVLCAAFCLCLFAVIGVGLAARAGRWWLPGVIAGIFALASLLFMAKDAMEAGPAESVLSVVLLVLAAPSIPWILLWYLTIVDSAWSATVVTLAIALALVWFGWRAVRRRAARAAAALAG